MTNITVLIDALKKRYNRWRLPVPETAKINQKIIILCIDTRRGFARVSYHSEKRTQRNEKHHRKHN